MATTRDTSKDGLRNKLENFVLTRFKPVWRLVQANQGLAKRVNKFLINNAIYKVPTRPHPFSTLSPYTSWDSLTDRTYSGLHLPPLNWQPLTSQDHYDINLSTPQDFEEKWPDVKDLEVLYKKTGDTKYSPKSTLIFPYFVQWFTDSFLRTDRQNQLRNTSHHHINLCTVYGLTPEVTKLLRLHQGGKLKSQMIDGEEYPPFYYDESGQRKEEFRGLLHQPTSALDPTPKSDNFPLEQRIKLFATGVEIERANVQIGYTMLNVLALREHNRLCDCLAQHYPTWDDERLFQTARNILIVEVLRIVIEEYVNHITPYHFNFITDPLAFTKEKWYRQNWMTVEFTLVYRWHSMLPETILYDGQPMAMTDTQWNNDLIIRKGLGPLFEETCAQPAAQLSLFNTATSLVPVELASIRFGRRAKLRSYNDYRDLCQYPRVTQFEQISSDEAVRQQLKRLYGHVDNIELYVGLYAEDLRENSALPPLVGRLIGIDAFSQVLTNPLLAEHIFNPETFSPVGWAEIEKTTTLSQLLHRNIPTGKAAYRVSFDR